MHCVQLSGASHVAQKNGQLMTGGSTIVHHPVGDPIGAGVSKSLGLHSPNSGGRGSVTVAQGVGDAWVSCRYMIMCCRGLGMLGSDSAVGHR